MEITIKHWQIASFVVLFVGLLLASYSDLRFRRVPNWITGLLAALGLTLNSAFPGTESGLFVSLPGPLGATLSLGGLGLALVVFLPFWIIRLLGAGDVKLMAAIGAFAGPSAMPDLTLFVLLSGGALALVHMVVMRSGREVMYNTAALFGQTRANSSGSFNARHQTAWRMPYAVAITGGVALYAWWTLSGRAPILSF